MTPTPGSARSTPRRAGGSWLVVLILARAAAAQGPDDLVTRALEAMRQATLAAHQRLGVDGAYRDREPGDANTEFGATDSVGVRLVQAYELTGEDLYLRLAVEVAEQRAASQLASGGWSVHSVADDGRFYLRSAARRAEPRNGRDDLSRLDSHTPGSLHILLKVAGWTHRADLDESADYASRALLQAQLDSGAWPNTWPPESTPGAAPPDREVGQTAAILGVLALAHEHGRTWVAPAARRAAACLAAKQPAAPAADSGETDVPHAAGVHRALAAWQRIEPDAAIAAALGETTPSRAERAERTARRTPRIVGIVDEITGSGEWRRPGQLVAGDYLAVMDDLLTFIAEYEPLPEPLESARPPQHRR